MKSFTSLLSVLSLLLGVALATTNQYATPSQPQVRVEWRQLSSSAQADYIKSVKCLDKLPSKIGLKTSRYNDFPYIHTKLNIQNISKSPVFSKDKARGFGGNGLNGGIVNPSRPNPLTMCVLDGAFNNFTVQYYGAASRPHCLNRGFNDGVDQAGKFQGDSYSSQAVSKLGDSSKNFTVFADSLENGPHGAIHQAVGGDLVPATSPNDPLFFLHHAQIDRLWWIWQQKNPKQRNSDYSGIRILASGARAEKPASLNDSLPMLGLGPDKLVSELMTTSSSLLNYRYK
ncbi:hypothetical protein F66182_4945 [Fusarium sp. NRRL 66182]|nr:hypothetical protein F66182_4945 [Fusarium sp. NRRL 66182]